MHQIRVFVADDHVAIREGLRHILERQGFAISGEASCVEDTVKSVGRISTDIWVVDLNMGGDQPAASIIQLMQAREPAIRIAVYSMRRAAATISAVYRAGAQAYISKNADPEEIVQALTDVWHGRTYFNPRIAEQLALYHSREEHLNPKVALSPREFEIFMLLAHGHTVAEVAQKLGLGEKTVGNQTVTISNKLGIERMHFTRTAIAHGLIDTV